MWLLRMSSSTCFVAEKLIRGVTVHVLKNDTSNLLRLLLLGSVGLPRILLGYQAHGGDWVEGGYILDQNLGVITIFFLLCRSTRMHVLGFAPEYD